jgi:hypothetical protein
MNWLTTGLEGLLGFGGAAQSAVSNWFGSIAGQLASAFEAGFLAVVKDLWDVVVGPLEIIVGVFFFLFGLIFAIKDDMIGIATVAAIAA